MLKQNELPIIFLAGPPGVGKSSLGSKVCKNLNLKFLDLSVPSIQNNPLTSEIEQFETTIDKHSAGVVALSWRLQQDKNIRTLARKSGFLLLLWAHPLDMQSRSGYSESLFTPVGRLKTKGGFGRNGTGCKEFRSLDRTSTETLMLVDTPFDDAIKYLQKYIVSIHKEVSEPPMIREGLDYWVNTWHAEYDIKKETLNIIADAMARYALHLKSQGASSRSISAVYDDLEAAGLLVMMYDAPKGQNIEKVLSNFYSPPWVYEFERKFTDSPKAIARYEKNLEGFSRFLQESGMLPKDD